MHEVPPANPTAKLLKDFEDGYTNVAVWKGSANQLKNVGDTIYYWDIADSIPGNWTQTDETGNGRYFRWSNIGPIGAYTGNPNWNDPLMPLASTTSANGFLLFPGDEYNTDPATGTLDPNYVNHYTYIMTDVIDLSAYSSIIVRFQERFRTCCAADGELYLGVTTDGGTTWTDYSVREGVAHNSHSCPDTTVTQVAVNISGVAQGSSTVQLRFYISNISHYYWMIDDIAITEGYTEDIIMERSYADFFAFDDGFYTQIPIVQTKYDPIGFHAAIFNNGSSTQTNVLLNIDVNKNGNSYFTQNSATEYPVASFAALARDTILLLGDDFYTSSQGFPASMFANGKGTYDITWNITSDLTDQNPADNMSTGQFIVGDSLYARDDGTRESSCGPYMWASSGENGDVFGVRYAINDDSLLTEVNSILFYISPRTDTVNLPSIRGVLYVSDGQGGYNEIISTDVYDLTLNDLDTWLALPFIKDGYSEFLMEGQYVAALEVVDDYGGDGVWIGEDSDTRQVEWATLWYLVSNPSWYYFSNYGLNRTPMIRLKFDWTDNVDEVAQSLKKVGQNYPNPFSDFTYVDVNTDKSSDITLIVNDLTGKTVFSMTKENAPAGKHRITMDAKDLDSGVYYYTVKTNEFEITRRMVVVK
ncbi:MAG: hypothetical protein Kow0068_18140 [Marinilabiliales bacterium]